MKTHNEEVGLVTVYDMRDHGGVAVGLGPQMALNCRQIHFTRDFLDTFILVHTSHCGLR